MTPDAPENAARPAAGLRLGAVDDLRDPGVKGFRFTAGDHQFAGFVVRRHGLVRGFVDSCPHAGWPLALRDDHYLTRDGALLLCAGHGALFRPEDGVCTAGPCAGRSLEQWPVVVRDGDIFTE